MESSSLMAAIDIIRNGLTRAGVPEAIVPKEAKPATVAFVDVNACTACGLCAPLCPALCIESLAAGVVTGRDPQPVQIRFHECVGCHVCVEVCTHLAGVEAIRAYDANLAEQVLSTEIGDRPEPAGVAPEAWDELWAEGGGFHHMGEGSRIASLLGPADRALLDNERLGSS